DEAIENYHLCTENERCGLETLRTLADLYERKGDCLYACRITEQALLYNAKDKDLLARKDKYYWSITPEDLQARLDYARSWFDVNYCLNKSQAVLDAKAWDLDSLDWAQHLATLAHMVKPESLSAKVLLARALLRRGEKDQALALLERVHSPRPQKFADDDEDAWYTGSKLLGELYLYDFHKPDLAVECFRAFRESTRSGADTLYKLGQAYEQLGDRPRAIKCYQQVAAFSDHPLAPDAQDALRRLEPPE
ncbi:MAG TPA: tetratricopeptide repeat protein, partial [Gemmataceae bacterium]|nr:tetratricopeptide repeat protein [Gemmataceae bacterium]